MATEFSIREERFKSELSYLFDQLYSGKKEEFAALSELLSESWKVRPNALKKRDRNARDNPEWYRRSSLQAFLIEDGLGFSEKSREAGKEKYIRYTFGSTLTEAAHFLKAARDILQFANEGADVVRLEGIPELFKIPGTEWQHQQKLHTVLRLFRIITETVCPSLLLAGDVEGDTAAVSGYFGSYDKPELHLMEDANFVPTLWQTVATADTRLLAYEISKASQRPKYQVFLRGFEKPEGFMWNLDFDYLEILKMDKDSHLRFLNAYFGGKYKASPAKAKIIRERKTGKSGVRGSLEELAGNGQKKAVSELLQAYLLMMSGIPEVTKSSAVRKLLKWRKLYHVFDCGADMWTVSTDNNSVIGVGRYKEGQKIYGLYNFSPEEQIFSLHDPGTYQNLVNGKVSKVTSLVRLQPYAYAWLVGKEEE